MKIVAIDIETKSVSDKPDPYQDEILLTSVITDEGKEYIFDRLQYPDWLLGVLENSNILKLAHNASFEWQFFKHNFDIRMTNIWDTFAIERVLTAGKGLPCDLETVTQRRLSKQLDKSIRERFKYGIVGIEERKYCLEDSRVLFPIYEQQLRAVKETGQLFAAELESRISAVVGTMELHGVCFDKDLWEFYIPIMEQHIKEAQQTIWDYIGNPCTQDMFSGIGSGIPLTCRDKILEALRRKGLKLSDYQSSTIQETLLKTESKEHSLILKALLDFKTWNMALGWNYPQYIHSITNRIHANFHAQGADTFRFTSSKPNLQQVTKPFGNINFRHLFKAAEGNKIIGADYSQIELRLLAEASDEDHYIESFVNGKDMHTFMAESLLGRKLKDKEERNLGKAANFGVVAYGGSISALQKVALDYGFFLSEKEAKIYVKRIRRTNSKVELWGKRMHNLMNSQGYIQTPMGHRRWLQTENRETVARNTPIQMYAAGLMKLGLVKVFDNLKGKNANIWLQVHDELAVECKEDIVEEVSEIIKKSLIEAWDEWIERIPMQVDIYVSDTWEK